MSPAKSFHESRRASMVAGNLVESRSIAPSPARRNPSLNLASDHQQVNVVRGSTREEERYLLVRTRRTRSAGDATQCAAEDCEQRGQVVVIEAEHRTKEEVDRALIEHVVCAAEDKERGDDFVARTEAKARIR